MTTVQPYIIANRKSQILVIFNLFLFKRNFVTHTYIRWEFWKHEKNVFAASLFLSAGFAYRSPPRSVKLKSEVGYLTVQAPWNKAWIARSHGKAIALCVCAY